LTSPKYPFPAARQPNNTVESSCRANYTKRHFLSHSDLLFPLPRATFQQT